MSPRKRIRLIGVLLLVFLMGIIFWRFNGSKSNHKFSGYDAMPVEAAAEENNIQFKSEVIKPEAQGESYFVNYRLDREQFREKSANMLKDLLNSNVAQTKEEAQAQWLELSKKIEEEGEIENLLKIKGFQDAVTNVSPDGVNVIVLASSLSPNELGLIQDIVYQITNVRLDNITISTINPN